MARNEPQPLGERELDIMEALWRLGGATVAETHAELVAGGHGVAYTTVQTMLNRLEAKGVVERDSTDRAHRYRPLLERRAAVGGAIRRLARRFFDGSKEALAAHLVEKDLTADQLERIRAVLDESRARRRRR